jgi:hypothetical protein
MWSMIKSPNPIDDKIFAPQKTMKNSSLRLNLSSWDNGVHEILEFA